MILNDSLETQKHGCVEDETTCLVQTEKFHLIDSKGYLFVKIISLRRQHYNKGSSPNFTFNI